MSLTRDEVQHVARLARIGLSDAEVEKYQKDLAGVFGLIEELQEAKVESLDTASSDRETNRTREDVASESGMSAPIQKNFPQGRDGYNKVRAVF